MESDFLDRYKILLTCKNNFNDILRSLQEVEAGKVVLRYNLPPEKYWEVRNSYEKNLHGEKKVYLFINDKNNESIVCEKIRMC